MQYMLQLCDSHALCTMEQAGFGSQSVWHTRSVFLLEHVVMQPLSSLFFTVCHACLLTEPPVDNA